MSQPIVVVASLWVREGRVAEFEAYERKASRIMKRYGGVIERAVRVDAGTPSDRPFEVHFVSFPSQAMFDAYRADAELNTLSDEREAVITKSVVLLGTSGPAYVA
jgi:uncharacterized protein (DUF1330 family)